MIDVIVIGAGPSGASCAYNLKRFNPDASVMLIDKAEFPRYKPCGGGISPEVANYLDFDIEEALSYRCKQLVLNANGTQKTNNNCDILMVRREAFDCFLMEKAKQKGVTVETGCEVVDVENTKTHAIVKTKKGDFSAKIVVLAEGGAGRLARKLDISANNNVVAALEYEHYQEKNDGSLHIDFDQNNNGYAWIFPKSDGLSIGIGGFSVGKENGNKGLPQKLKKYADNLGISELHREHLHGHPIQIYSGRKKLVHDRIMLIGEIAGCVDPLTAEGIRPAIKSGFLAAKILAEAIAKNDYRIIKKYDRAFHHEIGKDFRYARVVSYFLNRHMKKLLPYFSTNRAANTFVTVFSGQSQYRDHVSLKKVMRMLRVILPR